MTTLRSKKDIEMAEALYNLNAQRRDLEKQEKALKEYFKEKLGTNGVAKAGGYVVITSEKSRKDLDRKALAEVVDLTTYQIERSYCILEIKKAS